MQTIQNLVKAFSAKISVAVVAVVVIAAASAIAAPDLGSGDGHDDAGSEEATSPPGVPDESLETVEAYCDAEPDAPFCRGPSDQDGPPRDPDEGSEDGEDGAEDDPGGDLSGDPEEREGQAGDFAAWVRSLPKDWGCIRGRLVSHAAQAGPHSGAHEELQFDTAAEAAAYLGLEGRCVDLAIARSGGEAEDAEVADYRERVTTGPPVHAGRPDKADRKQPETTQSTGAGDEAEAGPPARQGPPSGHAGKTGDQDRPKASEERGRPGHAGAKGRGR